MGENGLPMGSGGRGWNTQRRGWAGNVQPTPTGCHVLQGALPPPLETLSRASAMQKELERKMRLNELFIRLVGDTGVLITDRVLN